MAILDNFYLSLLAAGLFTTALAAPAAALVPLPAVSEDTWGIATAPEDSAETSATAEPLSVAQTVSEDIAIRDVQISAIETGLSIVIAADQPISASAPDTIGNAVVVDIANATLDLVDETAAEQFSPADGIALVQVSALPGGGVRLAITGTDAPPEVQITAEAGNLVVNVSPGMATVATEDDDGIQVIVSATRTEESILDVPRSVTVIERAQIEQQQQFTDNLPDILGRLVPGLGPPTLQNSTRALSLRGRPPLILIDGVPQTPNSGFNTELNTIDPTAVERIEIVRGPSATYGDGATGGIINIITRAATDQPISYDISLGASTSLTAIGGDAFGYNLELGVAGSDGGFDGRLLLSYDVNNSFFDANGDRIPPNGLSDTDSIGLLTKLGYDFDEQQRLEFTYSFLREILDTNFAADPIVRNIPGLQAARALEVGALNYEAEPQQINHVFNLTYRHANLLSSQLDAQFYYRDTDLAQGFTDLRGRTLPAFFPRLWQTALESNELGGRLQFDTALGENFGLLWGADYAQETNERLVLVSDIPTFDATRTLDVIERLNQAPRYELNSLGLFAQATWDISEQWQVSGGLRYDNFNFSVDDSRLAFSFPQDRRGGSGSADDVSFNAGLIYRPIPEVSLFASYARGFSIPDLGLTLAFVVPATADISSNLILEPQTVDNFEIGVGVELGQFQATLAGFYNESSLGTSLSVAPNGFTQVSRSPQRNYGVEATFDWQPSNALRLGGYFSWNEGEDDDNNDGIFLPLSSLQVQPYKLGFYIENDTAPGWTNRLQLLAVGGRSRAFEQGVDGFNVSSYITLDLLSSLQIGQGQLTLGIENILNNQYFPVSSQERFGGTEERRFAAPGATLSLRYSISF